MPSMPSMPSIAIAEDDGEETASQGYNLLDDESVLGGKREATPFVM